MINLFPYTDAHELNLDWVVEQVKANNTKVKDLTHTVENMHFDFDSKADKATTYTKTEVNTLLAAKANTSSLATVATSGNYNDLTNKPTIPAAQVNADWDAVSGVAQILNKPTIPAAQVNSDWDAVSGVAQILNKPTIPAAQVNSDWDAVSGVAQILNKPKLLSSDNVDYSQFSWDDTNKRYICTYNVPAGKELIGVLVTSKNAPQGIAVMNGYYNSGINTIMVTGWNVAQAAPISSSYQFICNVILKDL